MFCNEAYCYDEESEMRKGELQMKQSKQRTMEINEKTSMLLLAGPIFIELLLNILINNVDTVMLSRYDENSVGAVEMRTR